MSTTHPVIRLVGGPPKVDGTVIDLRLSDRDRADAAGDQFVRACKGSTITSLASRDGRYRLSCCDSCMRYIKAYDARRAGRPVLPVVDSIATLPLDAAAMQRGYH